jgi:hypothetical protein
MIVKTIMRKALLRGAHVKETKDLENTMRKLLRERNELMEKRDKLAGVFGHLSAQASTLLDRYFSPIILM